MWKPIRLFSFLLLLSFVLAQQITKEFDINVELTGKVFEEKPKLIPPEKLPMPQTRELDLSSELLEPPKFMEFVPVKPVEKTGGVSCGEPKDALSYRLGVDYYLRGRYALAEEELSKVVLIPNSPFKPMAEYVLGLIAYSRDQKDKALELFRGSCQFSHIYQKPACEAYYALHFILRGSVPENRDELWQAVKAIKEGRVQEPNCSNVVFSQYCGYVADFVRGQENVLYKDSTSLRSAVVKYFSGDLRGAKETFSLYSAPSSPYREIALYYLALIEYREGKGEEAFRYASILESLNQRLTSELYALLSERDIYLSRLTYSITKNPNFLERAGIIAYNAGDYSLALLNFLEAGNVRYAVYSAIKMGDYIRVISLLENKKGKDREDYMWLLEALYWTNGDLNPVISEVSKLYPDLAREFSGWERFRRGDWLGALGFFEDPYYKSIALYNLKRYKEVINLLQGKTDQRSNILKSRSALMMGDTKLARSFLTERSDEELYLLGMSYFLEGEYQKAVSFFGKVSDKAPFKAKALLRMGDAYYNAGDGEKAKASYYEILRRYPDSEEAKQATLSLLEFSGKGVSDEEMEKLLLNYMQREKNPQPEVIYQYASLLARKGDKRGAERELLKLLDTPLRFKAILKMAEIEEDPAKKLVLYYKVYKEAELQEDKSKARDELIKLYTSARDTKSLADLLTEGDIQDKVKAVGLYISLRDIPSALSLSRELINAGYRSRDFEKYLIDLYRQSGETDLLSYVLKSPDKNLRGEALFLLGLVSLKKGDKKKALENFVEISLNYKDEPYYNQAVLEGAKILIELGARRDASCLLERFDLNKSKPEEINSYNKLRQGLPKCEVR
ncbi:MAG: tetratricopeptide repeat protein [Aquificaceae bacterium]